MDSLFLIFGWPGPVGVGVFLLLTLADIKNKEYKEKKKG